MTDVARRRREAWITALDALIIVCGCAAFVILLGGRTRGTFVGTSIKLLSPVNVAVACGVLLAVRLILNRRLRPLPSMASAAAPIEDLDPLRFAQPPAMTRSAGLYAVACVLGSTVWLWPHLTHPRSVPDVGDPLFNAWRIARVTHQITHDPRHLFDGNIFYPERLTMTYSDATLLEGIVGAPLILAGIDPLVASNLVFMLAFPGCGLAFFYAAWRLTRDPRAALVGGLLAAWYPFHAEHYSHMELQFFMFIPLALVCLLQALARPGWRTGTGLGAAVALQWLASLYIAVMLVTVLVPFTAMMAVAWRVRMSRRAMTAAITAVAIALAVIVPTGLPYMESRKTRGDRQPNEVRDGSAVPSDFAQAHPRLGNYGWMSRRGARIERQLFPGLSTYALVAVALAPPLSAPAMAVISCAALAFDWSLGLNGLTYDDLYRYVTPYRGMRVAARFDALLGSLLALLGAYGARRLITLPRRATLQAGVTIALALIVVIDLRVRLDLQEYKWTIPDLYARVTPADVLSEMPDGHVLDSMYFSTKHWGQLLGGYSGFFPDLRELNGARQAFPSPEAIATFHRIGATHLTYNCAFEVANGGTTGDCARVFDALDGNRSLELIATERWMGSDVRLYRYR